MKNACYLSYLTFDTTSYQSQEPNGPVYEEVSPKEEIELNTNQA